MRVTKHQVGKKNKKHVTKKNRKSRNGKIMKGKIMKGGLDPLTKEQEDQVEFWIYFCFALIAIGVSSATIMGIIQGISTSIFPDTSTALIKVLFNMCDLAVKLFTETGEFALRTLPSKLIGIVSNMAAIINANCTPVGAVGMTLTAVAVQNFVKKYGIFSNINDAIRSVADIKNNANDKEIVTQLAQTIFGSALKTVARGIIYGINYTRTQIDKTTKFANEVAAGGGEICASTDHGRTVHARIPDEKHILNAMRTSNTDEMLPVLIGTDNIDKVNKGKEKNRRSFEQNLQLFNEWTRTQQVQDAYSEKQEKSLHQKGLYRSLSAPDYLQTPTKKKRRTE